MTKNASEMDKVRAARQRNTQLGTLWSVIMFFVFLLTMLLNDVFAIFLINFFVGVILMWVLNLFSGDERETKRIACRECGKLYPRKYKAKCPQCGSWQGY
jgi:rRNA maturation endonuclease Nob1